MILSLIFLQPFFKKNIYPGKPLCTYQQRPEKRSNLATQVIDWVDCAGALGLQSAECSHTDAHTHVPESSNTTTVWSAGHWAAPLEQLQLFLHIDLSSQCRDRTGDHLRIKGGHQTPRTNRPSSLQTFGLGIITYRTVRKMSVTHPHRPEKRKRSNKGSLCG